MNNKQLIIILISVLFCSVVFAEDEDDIVSGASEAYIMGRLNTVDEMLQDKMPPKDRALLLYEKAILMGEAYKPKVGLRELTECIIEAIELDPYNNDYDVYLMEIYEKEWKHRVFSRDDAYSTIFADLKDKVEAILKVSGADGKQTIQHTSGRDE